MLRLNKLTLILFCAALFTMACGGDEATETAAHRSERNGLHANSTEAKWDASPTKDRKSFSGTTLIDRYRSMSSLSSAVLSRESATVAAWPDKWSAHPIHVTDVPRGAFLKARSNPKATHAHLSSARFLSRTRC